MSKILVLNKKISSNMRVFTSLPLFFLFLTLVVSCQTYDFDSESDESIVEKGIAEWNEQEPNAARFYWTNIRDKDTRIKHIGYIEKYKTAVKKMNKVIAAPPSSEQVYLDKYNEIHRVFSSYPEQLRIEKSVRDNMLPIAADRGRAFLNSYKVTKAQSLLKSAVDTYGSSPVISGILAESKVLYGSIKAEKDSNVMLKKARNIEEFYSKVDQYENTMAFLLKSEREFSDNAKKIKLDQRPYFFDGASSLKKKRQNTKMEMDKKLRERQYSFKDRIGEVFARVPEGDTLGSMSLYEILAFHEEIKKDVEEAYTEMEVFSKRFPRVIDKYMLKEVQDEKAILESKIAQVNAEIKTAEDIASRGKPAMPLMIGLFNSVPGGTKADKKSRPAKLRGKLGNNPHYWWGMVSIPTGTLNDLVITLEDDRPVRVFSQNTKSGRRISKLKDLVNRGYKIGNSWPVLNAGNQLPSGKYFVELQEGKESAYKGEVVVYSSFIMRMR